MFKYAWVRIFWVQRLEPVHNIGFQTVAGRHKSVQMRHKLPKLITGLAETGVQNVFRI